MSDLHALRERAVELGVEPSYWDVAGGYHDTPEHTLRAVIEVLEDDADPGTTRRLPPVIIGRPDARETARGRPVVLADGTAIDLPADLPVGCHELALDDGETSTLVVAPPVMPRDDELAGGAGLFVPTYALWERASPLPSFAHLAALAATAHRRGLTVLSTLPVYAAMLAEPFDPSPYAPASRLHWNEVYLDDASLPAAPTPTFGALIDWPELAGRRRRQLLEAVSDLDPYIETGINRFVARRPDVADFARWRAGTGDPSDAGHPRARVERSHLLAQYLADRQLAAIEGPGRATLALDLPIGSHPDGYETWAHRQLFAPGMEVGAPPDEFFAEGQNWGFPPQLPGAGRRSGHALWRDLVARAGEHASVLRIDHVMGVQRLWWIPEGCSATDGVYVRYPREELLAVIAAEAARTSTTIIGENLGTVPSEVTEALVRWDVVGMFEEQFNLYHRTALPPVPANSVAGIRTHDMPAFAAAFNGDATGGVYDYRRLVAAAVGHPVDDGAAAVLDAALERLAGSDAYLVVADLDDLMGETAPHNVPGKILPSTWRRRLRRPTSEVLGDTDVRRRLTILSDRKVTTR